jgi:membrane protease YdiL (CAAX protease family)
MYVARIAAVVEAVLAFIVVHVSFRAIKHFTVIGEWERAAQTNFTPGAVMIVFTVLALLIGRRDPKGYGLTIANWQRHLSVGLVACVVIASLSALAIAVTHIRFDATRDPGMLRGLGGALVGLIATLVIGWVLRKNFVWRIPWPASVAVIALIVLALPVVYKPNFIWTTLWLFFAAGFGEQIFYRGYIQSRVTEVFGKHCPGILVSSLLFGLLHAPNTVDYFRGRWDFAWWYARQSFFIGLFYGVLRARTGNVLPAAIAHGLGDVLARFGTMLRG